MRAGMSSHAQRMERHHEASIVMQAADKHQLQHSHTTSTQDDGNISMHAFSSLSTDL